MSKPITDMDDFQKVCREALIVWFETHPELGFGRAPKYDETFIVWSVKALGNFKCLVSTSLPNTIYAEYTYNGDKQELYEDTYEKITNTELKD